MRVEPHLSLEAVKARYREAKGGLEKTHWQVLRMAMEKKSAAEIARTVDFTRVWVFLLVGRYNREGPSGLEDFRRRNQGRPSLLTAEQVDELRQALGSKPPDGGLWNSTKVAAWMEAALGRPVKPQRAWDYMMRAGFTLQRPRPRHAEADLQAQEDFKKKPFRKPSKRSGRNTPRPKSNSGRRTSTGSA
jgi:transposase